MLCLLVFKEIEESVRSVQQRLAMLGDDADTTVDEYRLQLLMQIVKYVNGLSYLSHSASRAKLKLFLRNRYEYRETAEKLGVSVRSLHVTISYAAARLKKRLGCTLDLLLDGDLEAAEREFLIGTGGSPPDLFIRGIAERYDLVKSADVDVSTCARELRFLKFYSESSFAALDNAVDERCVSHLLFILLCNDSRYVRERGILTRIMTDELDVTEGVRLLKEEFVYG